MGYLKDALDRGAGELGSEKVPYRNSEGYPDPTAYRAIKNVDNEMNERFYKCLHTIFHVVELAGFRVEGRISLRDVKTGEVKD